MFWFYLDLIATFKLDSLSKDNPRPSQSSFIHVIWNVYSVEASYSRIEMTYEHNHQSQSQPQLVQIKFRFVSIPLNIITLYICSFYIWRPQATRRVGVKVQFNFQEVQTQPSL